MHYHWDRPRLKASTLRHSVRAMKAFALTCFVILLPLAAAGCGGDVVGPDGGPILPNPDSSACVRSDGTCVLCSDGMWHCNGAVYVTCPANAQPNGSCTAGTSDVECVDCTGGRASILLCAVGDTTWVDIFGTTISCSE